MAQNRKRDHPIAVAEGNAAHAHGIAAFEDPHSVTEKRMH